MNTRTKFTNIELSTKKKVYERDGGNCILCGILTDVPHASAHVVPRSKGGLGIEQNIVTLCTLCHYYLDQTVSRKMLMEKVEKYLKSKYPDWNPETLKYRKGMKYE